MIRIRSKKLLSGVSTLAVIAAFGAADPAFAGQVITSATNPNPPVNIAVGSTTSFVNISAGAIVNADTLGNSFTNSGSIFGANTALWVNQAILSGGISNTGYMDGNNYGIGIFNNSVVGGDIANSGQISGSTYGIWIDDSFIDGSLTNSATGSIGGSTGGVRLSGTSVLNGSITNDGSIFASGPAVDIGGSSVVVGGIENNGTILSLFTANAIGIAVQGSAVIAGGGIVNTGVIGAGLAGSANAILINTSGAIVGNIDNTGSISAGSATVAAAINLQSGVIAGSIINQSGGVISATNASTGTAVRLGGGTLAGSIDNTGSITGVDVGIAISGATVAGQILNQEGGVIEATSSSGVAVLLTGGTLAGGVDNQGSIIANASSGVGILMVGGSLQNGITNAGVISATGTSGTAVGLFGGTFAGGIANTGTIQGDSAGIVIAGATFTGGITNSGSVSAANGVGVGVFGSDLGGDFVNDADGGITAGGAGFSWTGTDFNGSVLNDGAITANNQGIIMVGTGTITGDVTNNGDITGSTAIALTAALIDGSVTNTSNLTGTNNGIVLNGTITGDVTNDGKITASANGIYINGVVEGALTNTNGIDPAIGINIDGQVVGGIFNSGDITATATGVDMTGATADHTITQTAGSITGPVALNLVNGDTDTFVGQGGVVAGNILADGVDDFSASGSGTFAYASGTATGIYHLDNDGSGLFVLGTDTRGVDGAGVTVTANHMYGNGVGAQFYIDDDTSITLANDLILDSGDNIEFHVSLPGGVEDAGQITAATGSITGSTVGVFIDPATMAAAPILTTTTLVYNNVINTGALTGTFANSATILSSSPFFTGSAQYDGDGTVDLLLNRLAFGDVLVAESHNQQAVGTALEQIYIAGGYSPDLQDAFEALFSAATTAEAQGMLIELSGSQHAQVGQAVQNVTNSINGLVRERLDSVLLSEDGVRMSGTPGQRYAQAVAIASDAATSGLRGSQGMSRGASGWSVWGRAFENEINVDTDADASGYDHDSQGGIVGVDMATSPNTTIGASAAYATSDVVFDASPDTADIESWQVNLFGSYGFGRFYLDGQGSYAWHDIGTLRSIDLPAPAGSDIATASYNASAWSVNGELGAIWRLGRVNMQPSVAVAYIDSSADSFTETSTTGYALIMNGADGESLSTTLALRASGQWMMAKTPVVPDFKIGWRHEFMDDNSSFSAAFIDDPSVVMSIVSSQVKADSLVISSGATFGVTTNFELFFDVNGQYNADASLTNASGGVRFTW